MSAALLGITIGFVVIAMSEPRLATAVLIVVAVANHVRERLRVSGIQAPAGFGIAAHAALAAIATTGLLGLLGPVAWALVMALAISGVPLVGRQQGRDRHGEVVSDPQTHSNVSHFDTSNNQRWATPMPHAGEGSTPAHLTASADSLSTPELCRAWSRSYAAMQMTASFRQLVRIIDARQVYLEALEERDPAGMARWLNAEPRADSDPTSFLNASVAQERPDRRQPGDGDGFTPGRG
jgi:hypothetical protein